MNILYKFRKRTDLLIALFAGLTGNARIDASIYSSSSIKPSEVQVTAQNEKLLLGDIWNSHDDADFSEVTETTISPMSSEYDNWFIAYDPATYDASKGSGVPFDQTWAFSNGYGGIENVIGVMWIR